MKLLWRPPFAILQRLTLLQRFTLTGLSVTVAVAALLGWILGQQLERAALVQEAQSASDSVTLVINPFLRRSDFEGGLSADRLLGLDRLIRERLLHEHMVRVKIWDRNGQIVYSTDTELIGQTYPVSHELEDALGGKLATEVSDLSKDENQAERASHHRLMEIYVPLRLDGEIVGAYEVYHDLALVDPGIAAMQRLLWLSLVAAFVLLYLALFGLVAQASRDLRRQSSELALFEAHREVDKLKGEFVSLVSHELRSPLAGLIGYSELLLTRDGDPSERREWLLMMRDQALRLDHMVTELLDVTKIEEGRIQAHCVPVEIRAVIYSALASFRSGPDFHRLSVQVPSELPQVHADPDKLTQVLSNLVSNAIKYAPGDGPITIAAKSIEDRVQLRVVDPGLGIPVEELPRLFRRFHRVRGSDRDGIPGTGLGLYITKQFVELQGGRIWAESPGPNRGSTFYVELPITEVAASPESGRAGVEAGANARLGSAEAAEKAAAKTA